MQRVQKCLVNEIQEVYRLQRVNIKGRHIEVIARQMMRWVKIEDVGDTEFLIEEQVDKFRFPCNKWCGERACVIGQHRRPATARPLLLGITARAGIDGTRAVIGILCLIKGVAFYRNVRIRADEYAFDVEEPLPRRAPAGDVE